ncbi:MAG: putative quinol monooxygenase [Promethearchaeota archaeon]|jgi:quinol monooxygenase YgiN
MEKISKIQANTLIKIPEGKLEEFKQLAIKHTKLAREKDTGTLKHDWFLSSDQTECVVREEFTSEKALIEHTINTSPLQGLWGDFSIDHAKLFGDLSPQLLEMLKGPNISPVKLYSFFMGLD